jgi:hypothetical protein
MIPDVFSYDYKLSVCSCDKADVCNMWKWDSFLICFHLTPFLLEGWWRVGWMSSVVLSLGLKVVEAARSNNDWWLLAGEIVYRLLTPRVSTLILGTESSRATSAEWVSARSFTVYGLYSWQCWNRMASWETMQMTAFVDAHAFVIILKYEVRLYNVQYGLDDPGL